MTKGVTEMKSLPVRMGAVLIGLFIFGHSEAWGEDWRLYWEDPFANYYYDADGIIRPSKNVVRVWQKIVYTKNGVAELVARLGEKFKTTSFEIDLSEFDCLQGEYKELQRTFFSQKATYLEQQSNSNLGSLVQGSAQEKLYRRICKPGEADVGPIEPKPESKEVKPAKPTKRKLK